MTTVNLVELLSGPADDDGAGVLDAGFEEASVDEASEVALDGAGVEEGAADDDAGVGVADEGAADDGELGGALDGVSLDD